MESCFRESIAPSLKVNYDSVWKVLCGKTVTFVNFFNFYVAFAPYRSPAGFGFRFPIARMAADSLLKNRLIFLWF